MERRDESRECERVNVGTKTGRHVEWIWLYDSVRMITMVGYKWELRKVDIWNGYGYMMV